MSIKATVLIPTTADRGPLLRYSVGSVLNQTVREIEVFIMGDGVDENTRKAITALMVQDERIRFFDHPKHERRGEPHRHAALQEARGEIVCYLCDRDLMLPHHIETLYGLLQQADFAHTLIWGIQEAGINFGFEVNVRSAQYRRRILADVNPIALSIVGHRLDRYHRLPFGWRTTPAGTFTDMYMWRQFLADPTCRAVSDTTPTILYLKRGAGYPGWPVERRAPELAAWSALIQDPSAYDPFMKAIRQDFRSPEIRLMRHVKGLLRMYPQFTPLWKMLLKLLKVPGWAKKRLLGRAVHRASETHWPAP